MRARSKHRHAREVYERLDPKGHGVITKDTFRRQLQDIDKSGRWHDLRKVRALLKAIDTNGDGCIQYEELCEFLGKSGDEWDEVRDSMAFRSSGDVHGDRMSILVPVVNGPPTSSYSVDGAKVGEGSFGAVRIASHKTTGEVRAIKSILKSRMDRQELDSEIEIMRRLDHPHIVRLYEVFEDAASVCMVMELCVGGELFQRIVEAKNFSERQAARVMQQVIGAVHYLHMHFVCHRDLKPENFLLSAKCPVEECKIKIIDFGTACRFRPGQMMTERVGTPFYVAPQVLHGSYDHLCDMWSCGVILFILISGGPPFVGASTDEITARILNGRFEFKASVWEDASEDARELVRYMLTWDPEERCTASQAASHTWIKDNAPRANDQPLQASELGKMAEFCKQNRLKKAALNVIAHGISEEQIRRLQAQFASLDKNGDGHITFRELADGISTLDTQLLGDLQRTMEGMDVDGSGSIDYTEFLAATLDRQHYEDERTCWQAFNSFDTDGSGTISRKELQSVLDDDEVGKILNRVDGAAEIFAQCDQDGDGQITFQEFMGMMKAK